MDHVTRDLYFFLANAYREFFQELCLSLILELDN